MSENDTLPATGDEANDLPEALDGTEFSKPPNDPLAIPYDRIRVPPDESYDDVNYAQRRAVLLSRIEQVGHPAALNQTYQDLADEFDTTKSNIHQDMAILAEWVARNLDRDHAAIMDAVFHGAVQDLVEEGKMAWAAQVGRDWFEWLADMGALDKQADRLELDAHMHHTSGDEDSYRVLDADEVGSYVAEHSEGEGE